MGQNIDLPHLIPFLNQSAIFVGNSARMHACGVSSASFKYAPSTPPCRFNLLFDLEIALLCSSSEVIKPVSLHMTFMLFSIKIGRIVFIAI